MNLRNIRLDIEYDGSGFAGWARQPGQLSIEGSLREILGRILGEEVNLSVAGRTDAGVHARGQVASFCTASAVDAGQLRRSANKLLPAGIVIKLVQDAPEGFDARYSAKARRYSYSVLNRAYPSPFRGKYVYYYRGQLDLQLLEKSAALILGKHDFKAFTPTVTEHSYFEREISLSEWARHEDLLVYHIAASSFMRNMVRVLAGTMLEIGRGYRPLDELAGLLSGEERPRAGVTAPAAGLCLEEVYY